MAKRRACHKTHLTEKNQKSKLPEEGSSLPESDLAMLKEPRPRMFSLSAPPMALSAGTKSVTPTLLSNGTPQCRFGRR